MQARKLITYHFFRLLSFKTHGIASVARLQREEVSSSAKEHGGTGIISTGIYEALHPLAILQFILISQSTPQICSQNLLQVLLLCKYTADATQI
jgi:hypothetical protein